MLGVDSNVIVRLLVSDDVAQQKAVISRLNEMRQRGEWAVVTPVVLAEVSWVLDSVYGFDRERVGAALKALLETPPFTVTGRASVVQAIAWYLAGPADFSDYLILALARAEGADRLLSFSKDMLKHPFALRP